ncbi:zinc-binding alcohol dehydrogenase family protein [Streptomyces sp. AV19]|uniref:quinone oxidoreductase family protein n=1 Tax=Streptomyces sp. AV19 TaxID=2793068 RepID=UPI0018FE5A97|nr:zinc-binding alcohol dehydrogenase family protein [Streptomyces sp. AV19]MBH1936199.1 zinc-binding alcohol dehydrogenase family protein [Streptomyces sp. AV19]MDG4534613.1 zinc-binding alcohol dehydrogenase family protein [Streptomyces sp. AV19]
MQAIQYREHGGYDQLRLVDLPVPEPAPGEALIRVTYGTVSPLDNTVRAGRMAPHLCKPLPLIPGGAAVGVVVTPGPSGPAAGTRVLLGGQGRGVSLDGTWREYVTAPVETLVPLPAEVSDRSVAALVAAAGHNTAYLALTELIGLRPGMTVLAPGIGGAVGMGAAQVAPLLGAERVISTASRTEKAEQARAAGFPHVIDLSRESLREGVARLTDGRGVDVVLDGVAGPLLGDLVASLAHGGSYVAIGYAGGTRGTVDVTDLIWKSARAYGYMFNMFPPETVRSAVRTLIGWLAEGRFDPVVAAEFPLAGAAEAQRFLIEERPFGRVLLEIGQPAG